jgi:hypothetical protein
MRKIDKRVNLLRVNILNEERYLRSKGIIKESHEEIDEDWKTNVAAGLMSMGAGANANAQSTPTANNNQQTISQSTNKSDTSGVADPFGVNKGNDKLEFKLMNTFKSGESVVNPNDSEVQQLLASIKQFSDKNPDVIIKIDVIGS